MADQTVFADDLAVGARYPLGTFTTDREEIVAFAKQWDPQSFHVDAAAAEAGFFGDVIASGIHSLAIAQRLSVLAVLDDWAVIAGRRLRDVEFLAPVRPDDILDGTLVIEAVDFDHRHRALVSYRVELTNQSAVRVLRLVIEAYVRARPEH